MNTCQLVSQYRWGHFRAAERAPEIAKGGLRIKRVSFIRRMARKKEGGKHKTSSMDYHNAHKKC